MTPGLRCGAAGLTESLEILDGHKQLIGPRSWVDLWKRCGVCERCVAEDRRRGVFTSSVLYAGGDGGKVGRRGGDEAKPRFSLVRVARAVLMSPIDRCEALGAE
jgi:hypothetical protein